jgi:hypothetical protein
MAQVKRKRNVIWRECKWCEKRNMEVRRFGKLKTLRRHEIECEALYRSEFQPSQNMPSIRTLLTMMKNMQKEIDSLKCEVSMLKETKHRSSRINPYLRMTPRKCWELRKENTIRAIQACMQSFEPGKYYKSAEDYLRFHLIGDIMDIQDILSICLWPILEMDEDEKIHLQRIDTRDIYSMCKQIWGKTQSSSNTLDFFREAIVECGLNADHFLNKNQYGDACSEFDRIIKKFQETCSRSSGSGVCWGINPMLRVWGKLYILPNKFIQVCNSLPPLEKLSLECE